MAPLRKGVRGDLLDFTGMSGMIPPAPFEKGGGSDGALSADGRGTGSPPKLDSGLKSMVLGSGLLIEVPIDAFGP